MTRVGTQSNIAQKPLDYRPLSLLRLSELIYRDADAEALRELHANRPLFRVNRSNPLLMADYLVHLKQRHIAYEWCGQDCMVLEKAYDLTLAKFFNLPLEGDAGMESGKTEGSDCRYYYKAFHDYAVTQLKRPSSQDVVRTEYLSAALLQKMVMRHFYLSCLEGRRQAQKFVKRYAWRLDGRTLYIWLPVEMPSRRCQAWLRDRIPDVDPKRPGERDRVQAIVNRLITKRRIFSLEQLGHHGRETSLSSNPGPPSIEEGISAEGLAGSLAEEKADNIEYQRPAIQSLGKARLRQLVCRIFADLVRERYEAKGIAADFGLSKATFSRFAGNRWSSASDKTAACPVPDLWRNFAHILASHDVFRKAAREAGVWRRVCDVVSAATNREGV